jgi:hypothetical protein
MEPPQVPRVLAPWSLRGHGWIVAMRWPARVADRAAFVPQALQASLAGPLSILMLVDYTESPCGPYRELLFIPGSMRFEDGRRHLSISRIVVSTWDSVVNGRANWGIPKDRADFRIDRGATERIEVRSGTQQMCALDFGAARGPRMPLSTTWLAQRWLTLAQVHDGYTYYYTPVARGAIRWCRLLDWRFGPTLFPDLSAARVAAAVRVEEFTMLFPQARVAARTHG